MKKNLLIDIQKWTEEPKSGILIYTYNIVKELARLNENAAPPDGGKFNIYFQQNKIVKKPVYEAIQKSGGNIKNSIKSILDLSPLLRDFGTAAYNSYKKYKLYSSSAKFLAKNAAGFFDSIYMPNAGYYLPPYKTDNLVVTVHDIASIETGNFIDKKMKNQNFLHKMESDIYRENLLYNIKAANFITTVSNFVKERLESILGIDGKKIGVVPNGTDFDKFKYIEDKESVKKRLKERYGVDFPFILYVGAIQPRKNVKGLIDAYLSSKKLTGDFRLVLVSGETWKSRETKDLILKNRDKIFNIKKIPASDLPLFYNAAEIFVYPSFYEGFGIPILEAFACGVPQALSNRTSIPEVGGEAAVYFDPSDTGDIKDKMESIAYSMELRKKLADAGLDRVKTFSWGNAASELMRLL